MFDNIVAKNELNFNDLEKKMFKFVCELGCSILKSMLEEYDKKLKESRDKKVFRHKGYKVNSIKTVLGVVTYKRAIYEVKDEKETKYIFLLDEVLKISGIGKLSINLIEKILSMAVETNSYRDASTQLMESINIAISHEGVRDVVLAEGKKIIEKEQEEIKLDKKDRLIAGTKEIPVLFEEADGLWINLQGKDRKEQIEKYKRICHKNGKEYKEPKRIKSELKLHISYEGWKKDDPRHTLVEKSYIVGFMSTKEMKQRRDAKIFQKYNVDKIKVRVLNGDGAKWINKLATKDTIRQKDNFHIHQEIIRDIPEEEHRRQIERLIAERRYEEIPIFLEYLRYEYGGEEKCLAKLNKLQSYLAEGLPRYQEVLEQQNRVLPEAPEGIEYKDPGIMESQIFTVLSKRFKSGRTSFSKLGATCLSKICAIKVENKGTIDLEKIETPIKIDTFVETYLNDIQKNLEEIGQIFRANKKEKEDKPCKQVTLNPKNPVLEIIKMTSISDMKLIYNFV